MFKPGNRGNGFYKNRLETRVDEYTYAIGYIVTYNTVLMLTYTNYNITYFVDRNQKTREPVIKH